MHFRLRRFASEIPSILIEISLKLLAVLILYHVYLIADAFNEVLIVTYYQKSSVIRIYRDGQCVHCVHIEMIRRLVH
mgnify:CR=1 FL=1